MPSWLSPFLFPMQSVLKLFHRAREVSFTIFFMGGGDNRLLRLLSCIFYFCQRSYFMHRAS